MAQQWEAGSGEAFKGDEIIRGVTLDHKRSYLPGEHSLSETTLISVVLVEGNLDCPAMSARSHFSSSSPCELTHVWPTAEAVVTLIP